jgi:hypothetical protein
MNQVGAPTVVSLHYRPACARANYLLPDVDTICAPT